MSNIKDETMMFNFGADDDKAAKALCRSAITFSTCFGSEKDCND